MRRKNVTAEMMKGYMADSLLLLLANKPYADISISEITTKAGVNRSTFYRNFKTKDELVKFYFNRIIYQHIEIIPKETMEMEEYLLGMFNHYYKYKKELLLVYRAGMAHLMLDVLNETFSEISNGKSSTEQYPLFFHTGGIYNTFVLWFTHNMKESPQEMAHIASSIMPKGFQPYLQRHVFERS